MGRSILSAVALAVVGAARVSALAGDEAHATPLLPSSPVWVENQGQWDPEVQWAALAGGVISCVAHDAWFLRAPGPPSVSSPRATVAIRVVGSTRWQVAGEAPSGSRHHFFLGQDYGRWRRELPGFARLRVHEVRPGVDLVLREQDGRIEYDLELASGCDPTDVVFECEGIDGLTLSVDGSLVLATGAGPLVQTVPSAWAVGPTGRRPVRCAFRVLSPTRYALEAPDLDPSAPLYIDPGLIWSGKIGGVYGTVRAVAADSVGRLVMVGQADMGFPTTGGAFQRNSTANVGGCVAKIDPLGRSLIWATYVASSAYDQPQALVLDDEDRVCFVGGTGGGDYPTTVNAFQPHSSQSGPVYWEEGFVTCLEPDGSGLSFSTYLGPAPSHLHAIALGDSGSILVTGQSLSSGFPTTQGAFQQTLAGPIDAMVARLSSDGRRLLAATYLGGGAGRGSDGGTAVAADPAGNIVVYGYTQSPDFSTTPGAYSRAFAGLADAFVARLSPDCGRLLSSTFLGGYWTDTPSAMALDLDGAAWVTGRTLSSDFPTTPDALRRAYYANPIPQDGFVSCIDSAGGLRYSSFVGGPSTDEFNAIHVSSAGIITLAGICDGHSFPTTPGALALLSSSSAVFAQRIDPANRRILYSGFLGGSQGSDAMAMAVLLDESVVVTGLTGAQDFPTTVPAWGPHAPGTNTGFLSRISMMPSGVEAYGAATPGCNGPLSINVSRMPVAGDPAFSFLCSGASPNTAGVLLVGARPESRGVPLLGAQLWVATAPVALWLPVQSPGRGPAETAVVLPPGSGGLQVFAQYLWLNPPGCAPGRTASATNALSVVVQ